MDWSGGPAALGGIMMCVALGGWSLGRWQALRKAGKDPRGSPRETAGARAPVPAPVEPCQYAARTERRLALSTIDRLGEIHVEISAYRRAEQVLAKIDGDALPLRAARAGRDCRYLGIVGEPTCGAAASARMACSLGTPCSKEDTLQPGPARPERMRQPSASGFTRV